MRSARTPLFTVVVLLAAAAAHATAQQEVKQAPSPDAQKAFTALKSLAGRWEGVVSTDPAVPQMGDGARMEVWLRVTSHGNALVHEMKEAGKPDDPTRYDHPVTVLYVDGERLLLTHYCDAGNRPRMQATASPDGKTVDFRFLDLSGPTTNGVMHDVVFTMTDPDHHTEQWTYMSPDGKSIRARFELKRVQQP